MLNRESVREYLTVYAITFAAVGSLVLAALTGAGLASLLKRLFK